MSQLITYANKAYDIKSTAPNNQLNFRRLVGYNWYLYLNMFVGAVQYDFVCYSGLYSSDGD